jgi:hypothetical protein
MNRCAAVNASAVVSVAFCGTITAMSPLTGVINESWLLYKAQARHLLTIAFVVYLIAGIISALLEELGGVFGALLALLVTIVAIFLLQAALVTAVQDVRDGRVDLSVGKTFSAATPFIPSVAAASILAGIVITFGLILFIIPGLALITIWSVIVPVIVLERSGALASFGRSQQLVRGRFWNVFGTLFLLFLIQFIVNFVLGVIFSFMPLVLGHFLGSVISGTLVAPFIAVVVTLMYFRLAAAPVPAGGGYGGPNPYGAPPPGPFGNQPPGQYGTGYPPAGQPDQGFPPSSAPGPGASSSNPSDGGSWPSS